MGPAVSDAQILLAGQRHHGEDVLLVMAKRNDRWIAGAINFIGSDTLFGRNWGAIEHHPFLHFESATIRRSILRIKRGLKTVEAGAQGEHKIARGYLRRPPIPRITSPIPICAPRLRII